MMDVEIDRRERGNSFTKERRKGAAVVFVISMNVSCIFFSFRRALSV